MEEITGLFEYMVIDNRNGMATKIQKIWRGYFIKRTNIPLVLQYARKLLLRSNIAMNDISSDGRVNSSLDELVVVRLLQKHFGNRIVIPNARMWYDLLIRDYTFGWVPVNIKTTTMLTNDNVGNLALCVYSYTDYEMDLRDSYQNGSMSSILYDKLKHKRYNCSYRRDYYFLVINKKRSDEIIVNSVRGLSRITHNPHNLPFQVKWSLNREYNYKPIQLSARQFLTCLKKNKPTWQSQFVSDIKSL